MLGEYCCNSTETSSFSNSGSKYSEQANIFLVENFICTDSDNCHYPMFDTENDSEYSSEEDLEAQVSSKP